MNRLWTRIFIIAACLLTLLFFSNDFGIIDIQKTAVVVALGIDKSEQAGKYNVTAQIAMPVASGTSGAESACLITINDVSTVGEAVSKINSQTGWFPTLVYCNLILFCTKTAREDVFNALDYFLRSDYVPDTSLVALVDGKCSEILGSQSPINDMSSAAITKTLSSEAQKSGMVSVINLRDFSKGYYSPSKSGYLPMIEAKPSENETPPPGGGADSEETAFKSGEMQAVPAFARPKDMKFKWWHLFRRNPLPVSAEESSSGGEGGGSGGGNSQSNTKIFNASKTALFYEGRHVGTLDEDETLALNLATSKTGLATMQVKVDEEGSETDYTLWVKVKSRGTKLKAEQDFAKFTVNVECEAQVTDTSKAKSIEEITRSQIVEPNVLQAAERHLTDKLSSVFEKSVESRCDIYGLLQNLYRHNYKYYDSMKDSVLESAHPVYNVKFKTFK